MSRFNKTYDFEQKLTRAKNLLAQSKQNEAEILLKECYTYFDEEHLLIKKLDTIDHLIALYLTLKDDDKVRKFLSEYETESKENKIELSAGMYHNYGMFYSREGDIERSIANYKKAIEKSLAINDPLHAAISYLNLGEQFRDIGDFEQAAINFRRSIDIFLQSNQAIYAMNPFISLIEMLIKLRGKTIPVDLNYMEDILSKYNIPKSSTLATTYINIALIFQELGNLNKSISYLYESIKISREINHADTLFHAYLNLGHVYENLKDYPTAINYIKQALEYFKEKNNDELIAKCFHGLALIYKDMNELDNSLSYINQSLEISKNITNFELNLRNNEFLADLYKKKKEFEKSFLVYAQILKIYKNLTEKTTLLGLKQIFREQFTRILHLLEDVNTLLKTQSYEIKVETLEDFKNDAINICKTFTSNRILEGQQEVQFREEIKKLKKEIDEYKSLLNDRDKKKLEELAIEDICNRVPYYQGEAITAKKIREFLLNIPDPILRHNFLIKILSRIPEYYYTKDLMYKRLKNLIENLPFDEGDELIFGVLSETWNKSQNFWSYISERSISRYSNTEIKKTPQILKYLSKVQSNKKYFVLFLDDVIGSGRQFIKYYKNDFETQLNKYPITEKKNINLFLICGIISMEALEYISMNSIFKKDSIRYDKIIKKEDKAFYEGNWDKEILSNLKDFLYHIDPNNWDGWKEDPKEKGMEYLVVLDWRIPNNTIGILWNKTAKTEPLFPR